jgi:NodT family efflux transporter outer membrane factor (OMF) lipoprotein
MTRIGFIVIAWMMAAACAAVGPDYRKTEPPMPSSFGHLKEGTATVGAPSQRLFGPWWQELGDPVLDRLMDHAVKGSPDLRIALARVNQARALAGVRTYHLLPEGGPRGSYEAYRRSDATLPGQPGETPTPRRRGDLYEIGFDASWEIDIFGGLRREIEAAEADLDASEEAMRDVLVTLQGEVARNYVELRGQQLRMEIARSELHSRETHRAISESRFQAGLATQLELSRAQGERALAESRIPLLENAILASIHRLGILLGWEPMRLVPELSQPAPIPEIPLPLRIGLPSELLRQRPDVRKAERDVAAATARIGIATADLFPRFSLTGAFGYLDDDLDTLSWRSGHFWRIGPSFRWPILNFKRVLAGIEAREAVRDERLAHYEKVVLTSLEEVETALVTLSRERQRTEALSAAVEANQLAVALADELYRAGAQSYLAVLDAETALFSAQDLLAQSRQNRVLAFVALYKALGGGWQEETPMEGKAAVRGTGVSQEANERGGRHHDGDGRHRGS